jgi:hypothetical protein
MNYISVNRLIRNIDPIRFTRAEDAFYGKSDRLTPVMRSRVMFTYTDMPEVELITSEEMSRVQEVAGGPFDREAQDALWQRLMRHMPLPYLMRHDVPTWPANVTVRGVNERHIWLGTHPQHNQERAYVRGALQRYIPEMFGCSKSEILDCWERHYEPGFHLATVEPVNSEMISREVVRLIEASEALERMISLNGIQMVTADRRL